MKVMIAMLVVLFLIVLVIGIKNQVTKKKRVSGQNTKRKNQESERTLHVHTFKPKENPFLADSNVAIDQFSNTPPISIKSSKTNECSSSSDRGGSSESFGGYSGGGSSSSSSSSSDGGGGGCD